jgi:uncharacterized protein (TIGR02266 family)
MSEKGRGGADQRRAPRYPVNLEVRFRSNAELLQEHATNISRGGLFVRSERKFQLNAAVALTIHLPNGQALDATARVAHVHRSPDGPGAGLQFTGDNRDFYLALDRYLAELAESAEA